MRNLIISRAGEEISLPAVKELHIGGESVCYQTQMASGKIVRDEIGFRTIISVEWEWLPAKTMTALHAMLRRGGFFVVKYPDPANGDTEGVFSISVPESNVFTWRGNAPFWANVSLTLTSQEVTRA